MTAPFDTASGRLPWLSELGSPLLTDLYQFAMMQSYVSSGMHAKAVFEFFVRRLPPERSFLLAAGLEQLLDFLEKLRFAPDDLAWLEESGHADAGLLAYLRDLRFTGNVYGVREGSVVFADEPIVRIEAPLPEAQLIESRLINLLHFQTVVASKAARSVLAAPGKLLVDFGMRRAHGAEAALLAARAAYLAGFSGTATVLAARLFNIPIYGTMAHSFVQAFDTESAAFEHFAHSQPGDVVLLIDTYDTLKGAQKVVDLLPRLQNAGINIQGVRLDSGDLTELSRGTRDILDRGGASHIGIFASGGLNELELLRITQVGAPIDGFGVGTDLDVSSDAPYLDCAYKLQEYDGRACRKRSTGKSTWPGRKQIFRCFDKDGLAHRDVVALENESICGEPMLLPLMLHGERLQAPPALTSIRQFAIESVAALPDSLRTLTAATQYQVEISAGIRALAAEVDSQTC